AAGRRSAYGFFGAIRAPRPAARRARADPPVKTRVRGEPVPRPRMQVLELERLPRRARVADRRGGGPPDPGAGRARPAIPTGLPPDAGGDRLLGQPGVAERAGERSVACFGVIARGVQDAVSLGA